LTLRDVLPLKLPSPPYLAVSLEAPVAVKVNEQLPEPELSVPLQLLPVLDVTVTVPVGTPGPETVKLTVTAWPTCAGSGVFEVMMVVLFALSTVSVTEAVTVVKSIVSVGVKVTERVCVPAPSTVPAAGE
jgi:hypothetical protein